MSTCDRKPYHGLVSIGQYIVVLEGMTDGLKEVIFYMLIKRRTFTEDQWISLVGDTGIIHSLFSFQCPTGNTWSYFLQSFIRLLFFYGIFKDKYN